MGARGPAGVGSGLMRRRPRRATNLLRGEPVAQLPAEGALAHYVTQYGRVDMIAVEQ
jgi:hypothetical protein